MKMSSYRNLSLDRSKHAWDAADQAQKDLRENFSEYVTLVKNLPARISNSGLGQTLAFLKSKGKKKENLLLDCIGEWLIDKMKVYPVNAENPSRDIMQRIQNGDTDQYRWATSEMMELITWLKLHSSSLNIKNEPTHQTNARENDNRENTAYETDGEASSGISGDIEGSDSNNPSDSVD